MIDQKSRWGSAAWFDHLYLEQDKDSSIAYFSYDKNGYQKLRHGRLLRSISEFSSLVESGVKLVDVGCATGYLTNKIRNALGIENVTGVDFSPELVKGATISFPEIRFLLGGLPDLPLEGGVTDVVSLIEVLYYVDKDKRSASIAECARLLRPGGIFIFAANVQGHPYLTRMEIVELMTTSGFKIEKEIGEFYRLAVLGEGVLMRVHRLCRLVLARTSDRDTKRRWLAIIVLFLRNPVGRLLAGIGLPLVERFLSCKLLFSFLAMLNRIIPGKSASHLIIFARKVCSAA